MRESSNAYHGQGGQTQRGFGARSRGGQGHGSNASLNGYTCFNCGGKGHMSSQCPTPKQDSSVTRSRNRYRRANRGGRGSGAAIRGVSQMQNASDASTSNGNGAGQQNLIGSGHMFTVMEECLLNTMEKNDATLHFLNMGTSGYFIPSQNDLHKYKLFHPPRILMMANSYIMAMGIGTLKFIVTVDGHVYKGELKDAYWVPDIYM